MAPLSPGRSSACALAKASLGQLRHHFEHGQVRAPLFTLEDAASPYTMMETLHALLNQVHSGYHSLRLLANKWLRAHGTHKPAAEVVAWAARQSTVSGDNTSKGAAWGQGYNLDPEMRSALGFDRPMMGWEGTQCKRMLQKVEEWLLPALKTLPEYAEICVWWRSMSGILLGMLEARPDPVRLKQQVDSFARSVNTAGIAAVYSLEAYDHLIFAHLVHQVVEFGSLTAYSSWGTEHWNLVYKRADHSTFGGGSVKCMPCEHARNSGCASRLSAVPLFNDLRQ